jgi:hypothetical protein
MKKYLGNIGALWLGFSIAHFTGFDFKTWQFWLIAFPTLVLFVADKEFNKEK